MERFIAILALVAQVLNIGMVFVSAYAPEYAVVAAGILAAIQAFTTKVTAPSVRR